ncbi:hypothetical protein Tco_1478228, partial [Tanacetum coccineum]
MVAGWRWWCGHVLFTVVVVCGVGDVVGMEMKVGMAAAVGGVVAAAAAAVGGDEVAVAHKDDDGVIGWKGRRWFRDGVAAVVW